MDLKDTYSEVDLRLKKINFTTLWYNFKRIAYILYNETRIYDGENFTNRNEDKDEIFNGNAVIFKDGNYVVIYDVSDDIDLDVITVDIVSLMFKGCQKINYESREISRYDGLLNYKYDIGNLSMKFKENEIIVKLCDNFSTSLFNELMSIKKCRRTLYNYEFEYETSVEQIEGTSYYVKLMSLRFLNRELYRQKIDELKRRLLDGKYYVPINEISAISGMFLIKILFANNIDFNYYFNNEYYISDLIASALDTSIRNTIEPSVQLAVIDFYNECNESINKAVMDKKSRVHLKGHCILNEINTTTSKYFNGFLITKLFFTYKFNKMNKVMYGDYVIKLGRDNAIDGLYQIIR